MLIINANNLHNFLTAYVAQYLPCEDTISFCHRYFHNQKNCNEGHGQSIAKTQCRKFCGICDVEDMPCSNSKCF